MLSWIAFYQMEPWGCDVEDQRWENAYRLLYSAHSRPGTKIPRFIERDPRPKPVQTADELDDSIRSYFAGRTVVRAADQTSSLSIPVEGEVVSG